MGRIVDLTGQKFGRLTVIRQSEKKGKNRNIYWLCQCECGNPCITQSYNLRSGNTNSCGCLAIDRIKHQGKLNSTHGMYRTPTYISWEAMRYRCSNPGHNSYATYGGRGISVCSRWQESFLNFLEDMGERPDGCSIDRIDPNGNYEPGNTKWAISSVQQNNKRNSRKVSIDGKIFLVREASNLTGIPYHTIIKRLNRGLSDAEALMPVGKQSA